MSSITKAERNKWESKLYIYEAALEVLKSKIKLVKIEYDSLAIKENYSEIQMITDRIKSPESIIGKLENRGLEFTCENINNYIHDVVGCRIVCLTLEDVNLVVHLLTNSLKNTQGFKLEKVKDYINNPKENGYQSYHFRVVVPVTFSDKEYNVPAEIQVRTLLMHAWAELEHKLGYKPISSNMQAMEETVRKQFKALATIVESTDNLVTTITSKKR